MTWPVIAYDRLHLPFHVTTWFAAVMGALIVSAVSLIMERILGFDKNKGVLPPRAARRWMTAHRR